MNLATERARHVLYGRRKGPRPSAHQANLRETLLPAIRFTPRPGVDARSQFPVPVDDVWLDVGFGGGEHLLWQVEHNPHVGLIGAEPYRAGIAKLLSRLAPSGTPYPVDLSSRIRIYEGDVRDVLDLLPDGSIGRVFILFPDPWPKRRHHKRRLIATDMLDRLGRVMKRGAELRFATDDADYLAWTLERLTVRSDFAWTAKCVSDWEARPGDWPQTRYELKALHGPPVYLRFVRM